MEGKRGKKLLFSSLFVLAAFLWCAVFSVVAAGANSPLLGLPQLEGEAGKQMEIDVELTSDGSVAGIQFDLSFDPNFLEYEDIAAGTLTSGFSVAANLVAPGQLRVLIFNTKLVNIEAGTGTVAGVSFKVAENARPGESSRLDFMKVNLSDENAQKIDPVQLRHGSLKIGGTATGPAPPPQPDPKPEDPKPEPEDKPALPPVDKDFLFVDLEGHWAAKNVLRLAGMGMIRGYQDNTFRPNNLITRLEVTVILVRLLGFDAAGTADMEAFEARFADAAQVPQWGRSEAAVAFRESLLQGYPQPDGSITFEPNRQIRRDELAVIMARILVQKRGAVTPSEPAFTDADRIPNWAREGVGIAVAAQIVSGYPDNTFRPANHVTRAEAAAMLERLYENIR